MTKEKIKSNKGITMVALVTTIIIMLILLGVSINGINISNNAVPYNNMVADITLLEEKLLLYYNRYKEIPKTEMAKQIDGVQYYEIDLSKLENVTLNYGIKYDGDEEDIYLVNDNLKVYYLKGIQKSGTIYHKVSF